MVGVDSVVGLIVSTVAGIAPPLSVWSDVASVPATASGRGGDGTCGLRGTFARDGITLSTSRSALTVSV